MAGAGRRIFLGLALLFCPALLPAQPPAERDWSAALRQDAQALHDEIAANHPGAVNELDPGFAKRNDAQLALALKRAEDARTYGDYFFPLREYVASFDDGHMGFGAFGDTPNDFTWPGFLTDYDARGDIRVVSRADDAPVPLGARLTGCDGRSAARVAAMTLGKMWGRWQLESQRRFQGPYLFLSEGSRYIRRPSVCDFDAEGQRKRVTLHWKPTSLRQVSERLGAIRRAAPRVFESRSLGNGARWYSLPSFDGDPQSPAGKALPPIVASMRADRAALSAVPAIVLDLRGNGGGSSDWSRQMAEILWGQDALERLPSNDTFVEWRVSRANLDSIEKSYAERRDGGVLSPRMRSWYETVIAGLTAALSRGDALWRHPNEEAQLAEAEPRPTPPTPFAGAVYVLTDEVCASACLDAVDLWRALGAVHVGRTTSADTLYMEVRQVKLPSGITAFSLPMKVYRNRARGSNEPAVPVHSFGGDIADTAAVERWILSLAAGRSRFGS
jgi:hypothetical protein